MKTALVLSPLVVDGKMYLPGTAEEPITVTAEESVLAPFVELSLAAWLLDGEVLPPAQQNAGEQPAASPPAEGAAPAKDEAHGG